MEHKEKVENSCSTTMREKTTVKKKICVHKMM